MPTRWPGISISEQISSQATHSPLFLLSFDNNQVSETNILVFNHLCDRVRSYCRRNYFLYICLHFLLVNSLKICLTQPHHLWLNDARPPLKTTFLPPSTSLIPSTNLLSFSYCYLISWTAAAILSLTSIFWHSYLFYYGSVFGSFCSHPSYQSKICCEVLHRFAQIILNLALIYMNQFMHALRSQISYVMVIVATIFYILAFSQLNKDIFRMR